MPTPFSAKLNFLMKALSIGNSQLAAELGVDKSIVRRWAAGVVEPSAHNQNRLTSLIAARFPGFTALDWDRDLESLASAIGVDGPHAMASGRHAAPGGLTLPLFDEILAATARRGPALHDHIMIRMDENGLLRFDMVSGGVDVQGWCLPMQHQIAVIGTELTSGALVFGIFNGVHTLKVGLIDGLILSCALDAGRTPTATAMILERAGEITDDIEADRRRLAELGGGDPVAPVGSVSVDIAGHLVRDVGPSQLAMGGDWLLRMPLFRSLSRGLKVD
jgi:hypothetical protein